jgi:hypothetical protein
MFVAVKPLPLVNGQNFATIPNGNTEGMGSAPISGNSSAIATKPEKSAELPAAPPIDPAQLQSLQEQVNETFGGYPQSLTRESTPSQILGPPPLNTATTPSTAPPSQGINGSSLNLLDNSTTSPNSTIPSPANNAINSQNISQQLAAPPTQIFKNNPITSVDPRSIINEPSVANKGPIVFYTGNWYAARSTDFGSTWKYVNPFSSMANFCCDQDVLYDPNHGVFLWYKQGIKNNNGENTFQLGVSKDASTWVFYNISPTQFNITWKNQWFDYPHLALTKNNLWISTNIFDQNGKFVRTVMSEWPLAQLSLGQPVFFRYFFETQEFNFTPVQGATDTMYWAVHHSNSQMKLYKWQESGSSINFKLVNIPAWNFGLRGNMNCPGPDTLNWCARSDSRISGGYFSQGVVGFIWHAKQGSGFPYPYVNIATFRTSDFGFLTNAKLWNPNFAFMFGYASPLNNPNKVGIVAIYGGGLYYPSISAGVVDSRDPPPPPFHLLNVKSGTNGASAYGDYIRDRPVNGLGPYWIGSGYTLQGCSGGNCVEPRFFAFGN